MRAPPLPLSIRNVSFGWTPDLKILKNINLEVQQGECVGLLGPNGCGKSTLLKLVLGPDAVERRQHQGAISIGGDTRLSARTRARRVSYVPQALPGAVHTTPRDMLRLARFPTRSLWTPWTQHDETLTQEAAASCRIEHLLDRPLHTLSGGEQQRVLLACAFAQNTPLLLLDEPTSALDPEHTLRLFELVRTHHTTHRSASLVAIHDLNTAAAFCDRIVLLHNTTIFAQGPPAEVLRPDILDAVYNIHAAVLNTPHRPSPVVLPLRSNTPL